MCSVLFRAVRGAGNRSLCFFRYYPSAVAKGLSQALSKAMDESFPPPRNPCPVDLVEGGRSSGQTLLV